MTPFVRSTADAHKYGKFVKEEPHACDENFWHPIYIQHLEVYMASKSLCAVNRSIIDKFLHFEENAVNVYDPFADNSTHDAIQINFQCQSCNQIFSITYEFGDSVNKTFGAYTLITSYKTAIRAKFPYSRIQEVLDLMDWKGEYNLLFQNCKHWAFRFYVHLTFYDRITSHLKKLMQFLKHFITFKMGILRKCNRPDFITLHVFKDLTAIVTCLIQINREIFHLRFSAGKYTSWGMGYYFRLLFCKALTENVDGFKPYSLAAHHGRKTVLTVIGQEVMEISMYIAQSIYNFNFWNASNCESYLLITEYFVNRSTFLSSTIAKIPEEYKLEFVAKFLHFSFRFSYEMLLIRIKIEKIDKLFHSYKMKNPAFLDFLKTWIFEAITKDQNEKLAKIYEINQFLVDVHGKNKKAPENWSYFSLLLDKLFPKIELSREEKIEKINEFLNSSMFPLAVNQKTFRELVTKEIQKQEVELSAEIQLEIEEILEFEFHTGLEKQFDKFDFYLNAYKNIGEKDKTIEELLETVKMMLNLREFFKTKDVV